MATQIDMAHARYNQSDEEAHILKDKEGEKKHGMNLAKSVMRARRSKIFDDYTFYITPQVQPSFEALKAISEAAGAKVGTYLPCSVAVATLTFHWQSRLLKNFRPSSKFQTVQTSL